LTPEGIDARYPALAPTGNSFVCLAISKKPDESPIQIYRVDSSNTGQPKFKQVSHIVASKVPNLPSWRVETHVKVNYIP
jgi:hypothetical protein